MPSYLHVYSHLYFSAQETWRIACSHPLPMPQHKHSTTYSYR